MKRMRWADLGDTREGHLFSAVLAGKYLYSGGIGFKRPGERTHCGSSTSTDRHVHDDAEVFVVLQGKGRMEVDGVFYELSVGDIFVVEPGEDHHLIADEIDPCVNLWLHAGDCRPNNREGHDVE